MRFELKYCVCGARVGAYAYLNRRRMKSRLNNGVVPEIKVAFGSKTPFRLGSIPLRPRAPQWNIVEFSSQVLIGNTSIQYGNGFERRPPPPSMVKL